MQSGRSEFAELRAARSNGPDCVAEAQVEELERLEKL